MEMLLEENEERKGRREGWRGQNVEDGIGGWGYIQR